MEDETKHVKLDKIINEIEADYWIREIIQTKITRPELPPEKFLELKKDDFEDLFLLRGKMEGLKVKLDSWLSNKKRKLKLTTTSLTFVDTASAYVWLPMVQDTVSNKPKLKPTEDSSVCITATPLDFRIHIEFGGYAIKKRQEFYEFIQSDEYLDYINNYIERSKYADEFKIFDTNWYTFIIEENRALDLVNQDNFKKLVNKATAKLNSTKENVPITWNRFLHGYVLYVNEMQKDIIKFNDITNRLEDIMELYRRFIAFQT